MTSLLKSDLPSAGLVARFFTHPMDTVKARLQIQGALSSQGGAGLQIGPQYTSTSDAITKASSDTHISDSPSFSVRLSSLPRRSASQKVATGMWSHHSCLLSVLQIMRAEGGRGFYRCALLHLRRQPGTVPLCFLGPRFSTVHGSTTSLRRRCHARPQLPSPSALQSCIATALHPALASSRGFGAVVTAVPMASAVYFWGYEFTKQAIGPSAGSTTGIVLGGMVAQAAAGLIYTPMDVIKERQQARSAECGARSAERKPCTFARMHLMHLISGVRHVLRTV